MSDVNRTFKNDSVKVSICIFSRNQSLWQAYNYLTFCLSVPWEEQPSLVAGHIGKQ